MTSDIEYVGRRYIKLRILGFVFFVMISMSRLALGMLYLGECKIQHLIPIYLIVSGIVPYIGGCIPMLLRYSNDMDAYNALYFLFTHIAMAGLNSFGSYAVYPTFHQMNSNDFHVCPGNGITTTNGCSTVACNILLFHYSFSTVTLDWLWICVISLTFWGLMINLGICCDISKYFMPDLTENQRIVENHHNRISDHAYGSTSYVFNGVNGDRSERENQSNQSISIQNNIHWAQRTNRESSDTRQTLISNNAIQGNGTQSSQSFRIPDNMQWVKETERHSRDVTQPLISGHTSPEYGTPLNQFIGIPSAMLWVIGR